MRHKKEVVSKSAGLLIVILASCCWASAQTWTPVTTFPGQGAGTAILMPNGAVLVEEVSGPNTSGGSGTGYWYVLHPDVHGTYNSGSWGGPVDSASLGYAPHFFGSAVLPDGRVVIVGGEYNFGVKADLTEGVIFDPNKGYFTNIFPGPPNWTTVGDPPTVVRANGAFMMGDCCSSNEALLNPKTLIWTTTGGGKNEPNSEEGWTLLPASTGNDVLTVDTQISLGSELFNPVTATWSPAANLPVEIAYNCGLSIVPELGPAVLRPDGTVFVAGANGLTAIYNSSTKKWSKGPIFPPNSQGLGQDGVADGPAALLPDGNVLVQASNINPCFIPPSDYFEFNGSKFNAVPGPPNASNEASFDGRMVVLPSGRILHTDGTTDVEIYSPSGSAKSSWAPTITSFPTTITFGGTYTFKGTQLNGLSQGAAYGDDAQAATNFPLVRLSIGGQTLYLPTKSFSSMGVATGTAVVSAKFSLPFYVGTGPATAVVVANGIASKAVSLTVK